MYTYFVKSNLARHQIFKANGLEWNDFDEDIGNELLEEMLRMNQIKHGHADSRTIHPTFPSLSTYYYVTDHGSTTTFATKDEETIAKTTDLNKKKGLEAIGLSAASSSSSVKPKTEVFAEKKQLQSQALKIKALQFQAVKVSTELAVKGMKNISLKQHHDDFEDAVKKFNEFAITISVGIAEIEGSEGEHTTYLLYFNNVRVCVFLGGLLLGEASC